MMETSRPNDVRAADAASDPAGAGPTPPADEALLASGWSALARVQPELAARLERGVSEAHLPRGEDGQPRLVWRGSEFPLALEGPARDGVLLQLDRADAGSSGETLLFGLGLGETLATALVRSAAPVLAWERDPALILATLARVDVAPALSTGRLRFSLGTDLLERCRGRRPATLRAHPLLGSVYARERRLVETGAHGTPAALAEGRLFVDQVGECLARLGYDPFTVDLRSLALEELDHQLRALEPRFLMEINHLPGTPEFCAERGVPYVSWEIDPSTERVAPASAPVPDARIHTYRRAHVPDFRAAGYERVEYTPLAADVQSRFPQELEEQERERYAADLAFVGASMVARAQASRAEFLELHGAWARRTGAPTEDVEATLDALLDDQARTPFDYRLPALLAEAFPEFLGHCQQRAAEGELLVRPELLVAESAASSKRLALLASLGSHPAVERGPVVWGDEGWSACESAGVTWAGGAGHAHELGRVYGGARINLDVGRLYQSDIVTMRVFDVLACGGFALVEHSDALEELFEVGVELDSYRDLDELQAKVTHWLAHEDERRAVAARGLQAVRERHAMQDRLAGMLAELAPTASA